MATQKKAARIVFEYRKQLYKLFSFIVGKDGSFYFHIYRHDDQRRQRVEVTRLSDGNLVIDGTKVVDDQFPAEKISRHRSGYIHIQDREGNREHDGIVSWSLADTGFKIILTVFPQTIDQLVKNDRPDPKRDLIVHLADDQEKEPFTVQVAVHKYGSPTNLPPTLFGNGVVSCKMDDVSTHELLFCFVPVTKNFSDSTFPARTVYLVG